MGSFYGGGGVPGGGGTSNYDDLKNAPIQNLKGSTQSRYVNLSGLDSGHYSLTGYYKNDSQSELQSTIEPIDMIISRDNSTDRLVAQYYTVEEEVLYVNLISFENGMVYKQSKLPVGGGSIQAEIYWGDIL